MVFFAGEHLSLHHGWILGSINSSLQAVSRIINKNEINFSKDGLMQFLDSYDIREEGKET